MATLTARTAGTPLALDSKLLLASSGFVMLAYVLLHMSGNLLAFAGAATFDGYARALRETGSPFIGPGILLVVARVVLAGALIAHVVAHVLTLLRPRARSRAPRYTPTPPGYVANTFLLPQATGAVILIFVAFHLAHLTVGASIPAFEPSSPYRNLITGLSSWPVALAYIAAAVAVGGHLLPGVWSAMRSLRLIGPRTEGAARVLAPSIAVIVTLGISTVPVAVLLGVLS